MGKRISASDLFENEDLFANVRKSAQETIADLERVDGEFKKLASTIKSAIGKSNTNSNQSIKEFIKLTERANKLAQDAIKIQNLKEKAVEQEYKAEQQLERLKQQRLKTEQENIRLSRLQQQEAARQAKEAEKAKKIAADEANAYKQLEKSVRSLKNESKRLGAEMLSLEAAGKKNSAEYQRLARTYDLVTQKAREGDAQLKKLDKTVGDNFRNVGNYKDALNKLQMGLGALGIAFGVGQALRVGGEAIVNFNQQVADLAAITGASGADLDFYAKKANELGMQVEGGAAAVVEAYKLIGSAKPELLKNSQALNAVTESAIMLSQAAGMELPEAATALTDAMNQFGASASEADKFVNVLANGAKFGSVEIPQITEALLKFGSVAKSTGTSIEESTALIELLGEKGLKGAEAGTALRNVMLKLSAPDALPTEAKKRLDDLGISLTELANPAISITEKLKLLKPLTEDNAALMKVFGVENSTAALALLQNTQRIEELNKQMETQGTAAEQAKQRTNTLGHALMELKNAFLGLFTSMASGGSAMQFFVDGIKFIARNLGTIVSIIFKVVRAWVIYQATIKSIQAYNWILNGGFKDLAKTIMAQIPNTRAYRLEQIQLARSAQQSGVAVQNAGRAMMAVPWLALIGILIEVANAFWDIASGAKAAEHAQKRQAEESVKAQQRAQLNLKNTTDAMNTQLRQLERDYKEKKNGITTESAYLKKKEEIIRATEAETNALKTKAMQQRSAAEQDAKFLKAESKYYNASREDMEIFFEKSKRIAAKYGLHHTSTTEQILAEAEARAKAYGEEEAAYTDMYNQIREDAEDASTEVRTQGRTHVNVTMANIKVQKEFNTTFSETNDYLQESLKLMQSLDEIMQDRETDQMAKDIDKLADKLVKLAESGSLPMGLPELKVAPKDATKSQIEEVDAENLKTLTEFSSKINRLIDERIQLQKTNLIQRNEFAKQQLTIDNEIAKETELNALAKERNNLLAQEGIDQKSIDKINENYAFKKAKLEVKFAQMDDDTRLKKLNLDAKLQDALAKLDEEGVDKKEEVNKKILEGYKQYLDEKNAAAKKADDDELAAAKKAADDRKAIAQALYDFLKELSDKRIAKLDEEIKAAESQLEHYKKLAEEGNINAQQSLAEQQRIIDEANRKKMIEQRRMAMLELAKTAYATYQDKVANKSKKPLAETIRDITLLQAFIKSIPAFEKGIEDTGTNGRGVDGKGGFHAILHPHERVIPKDLNAQIGELSNAELAKIAGNYRAGKIGDVTQTHSALNFALLVNELRDLKTVVKQKPETNIELGEITDSVMEIVQSVKRGSQTTYNRFKIKK